MLLCVFSEWIISQKKSKSYMKFSELFIFLQNIKKTTQRQHKSNVFLRWPTQCLCWMCDNYNYIQEEEPLKFTYKGFHPDINGKETIYLNGDPVRGIWVIGDLLHIKDDDRNIRFIGCG